MGAFLLDPTTMERLKEVRKYAENNQFTYEELIIMNTGGHAPYERLGNYNVLMSDLHESAFLFVYTIDEVLKGEKIRQLSVSHADRIGFPHPYAVEAVMIELGFKNKMKKCQVSFVENNTIIHIIEPYEQ